MRITVKLGGSILDDAPIRRGILEQIAALHNLGNEIILVHGGGKHLSRRLLQLGVPSDFLDGLRVTDETTLDVALMVLAGEVNKKLVAELLRAGCGAVGICGADGAAVRCAPLSREGEQPGKLGYVGAPTRLDKSIFETLLTLRLVPIVSSVALGEDFHFYNINADQMASICAWGTGSEALVYLTDVPGVMNENAVVMRNIGASDIAGLRRRGIIAGGMLPKTASCLEALDHGVRSVHIVPGASAGVLRRFAEGTLEEGTHIHGDAS